MIFLTQFPNEKKRVLHGTDMHPPHQLKVRTIAFQKTRINRQIIFLNLFLNIYVLLKNNAIKTVGQKLNIYKFQPTTGINKISSSPKNLCGYLQQENTKIKICSYKELLFAYKQDISLYFARFKNVLRQLRVNRGIDAVSCVREGGSRTKELTVLN